MGKHKKFLKSEKAKVKLKGHKLKTAQNVTKTDFKVRKIVITEQLKTIKKDEVTGLKIHNAADCLARLRTSSSPEALNNLKDIIMHQPLDFNKHLESIIKVVANLSLSIEKADRKMCFKLLDIIFTEAGVDKLKPFFPILVSYLKCAMTHIKSAIQEDSLMMLDVLLSNASTLVAAEKDNILPPYLNMISKMRADDKPERTLSLQLGNKITTIKWRKSVLERLILFLKCIRDEKDACRSQRNLNPVHTEIVVDQSTFYLGNPRSRFQKSFYYQEYPLMNLEPTIPDPKETGKVEVDDNKKILGYSEMIVPLLFETWLELKPSQGSLSETASSISNEAGYMLKIIMDVLLQLWEMMKMNEANKSWFISTYSDNYASYFLEKFPYFQNSVGPARKEVVGGEKCVYQNLHISYLFLIFYEKNRQKFGKYRGKIFQFVNDCIFQWKSKDNDFNQLLTKFISTAFLDSSNRSSFESESKKLFANLIEKYDFEKASKENDVKLGILCEMIEKSGVVDKRFVILLFRNFLLNYLKFL